MRRFQKKQQSANRFTVLMVLTVWSGVFLAWQAVGGQGYLKVVGPTPLRFESPNTNTLLTLKAVMRVPKPAVVEATNAVVTNVVAQAVNPVAANPATEISRVPTVANPVPEVEAVTNQAVGLDSGGAANAAGVNNANNISGDGSSSARDLLPVATSMITEYLNSNQGRATTNQADRPGATVFVPLQMGFTPPVMQGAAVVPESRAVYKSQ